MTGSVGDAGRGGGKAGERPPEAEAPVREREDPGRQPAGAGREPGGPVPEDADGSLTRREFLGRASRGAGALASAATLGPFLVGCGDDAVGPGWTPGPNPEVAVVGAGAFGGWTALHLQEMGARVTLLDQHGPGNLRSASGGETRGIRSAYGNRELWTRWAGRAIERWKAFDDEWAEELGVGRIFHSAGDLILRPAGDIFLDLTQETFDRVGTPYERLSIEEVEERWPWIRAQGFGTAFLDLTAGVARARRASEAVAEVVTRRGGELILARAEPGAESGGLLREVELEPRGTFSAEVFVFAVGSWFPKTFPRFMPGRVSVPMGHVFYFELPEGDERFRHPNMPSWGVPGVTGWPSLPVEPAGFRVRVGGRSGGLDPDASSREVPEEFVAEARGILEERFPDLADAPLREARACHYDFSSDGHWIVDRHPEWANVWLVGGGHAEGFKFGPVLGEYVAARILGDDPHPELADSFRL